MPLNLDTAFKFIKTVDQFVTQAHLQDQPQYLDVLDIMGTVNLYRGNLDDAQTEYARAVQLFGLHPSLATNIGDEAKLNLGYVLAEKAQYTEANRLIEEVLTKEAGLMPSSLETLADAWKVAAWVRDKQGNRVAAESAFREALTLVEKEYAKSLGWLSERDRLTYAGVYNYQASYLFSFCERDRSPACAELMYDALLWQKDMVASDIAAVQSRIATDQDPAVRERYKELREKRAEISAVKLLEASGRTGLGQNIESLEAQANTLEQTLVQKFPDLDETVGRALSWTDVRSVLAPSEAAIEFVRFTYNTGGSLYTNMGERYAALVLTHDSASPAIVDLGEAAKIENDAWGDYSRSLQGQSSTGKMYETVWKPLEPTIVGIKRVYVVPDGVLGKTSFGAIEDSTGTPLIQKFDFRVLSNSGDLAKAPVSAAVAKTGRTAVLFGDPAFLTSHSSPVALEQPADLRELDALSFDMHPTSLPETAIEVERISLMLRDKGWSVRTFTGKLATKAAVESVSRPRLLHIATHGYFISSSEARAIAKNMPSWYADDVLLQSGLLFAGSGSSDQPFLTGILTAFEASGLDLVNTELVVLSACDTGLGATENGEGVLGLRRALHEAGAHTIMMSLWSVPDRETEELMTAFYSSWLGGMEMHEALKAAQLDLRSKVIKRYGRDIPQYWAGFVLSD